MAWARHIPYMRDEILARILAGITRKENMGDLCSDIILKWIFRK